jgi:hypothetical protein
MGSHYQTYRNAAPTLREHGWLSPIPIRPGSKAPDVPRNWPTNGGWGAFANNPPTDAQIRTMGLYAHPNAGVGMVVNGDFVCVDADIRPKLGEPNYDRRLAAARDLMPKLIRLANTIVGFTPFIRRSHNPKFALFYAPAYAGDLVTIDIADNPVEVFGDPASARQIVIYGLHPDAGAPYAWIGGAAPLTHGPEHLPCVTADQLRDYHHSANAMAHAHDFMKLAPQKRSHQSTHNRNDRNLRASHPGSIGPYISAILKEIGQQPHRDPREVAQEHLGQANERYNPMSGCVGALIISGYSDSQIVQAVEDTYRQLFTADELRSHMAAFYASPAGLRKALSRGRTNLLLPVTELDEQLRVAEWSLFTVERDTPP